MKKIKNKTEMDLENQNYVNLIFIFFYLYNLKLIDWIRIASIYVC